MKILVIEHEPQLLELIVAALDSEHLLTGMATDYSSALDRLAENDYDAFVLDIDLPEAASLMEELRKRGRAAHVLLLAEPGSSEGTRAALDLGANDYLTKPFHISELIERVCALLDR